MEYDEIDRYVDQLFRDEGDKPDKPEVLSGDWRIDRIDRIDEIIQDTYDEAIWWHNNRISEGTDPRSGLRSLPYIPTDQTLDGIGKPWLGGEKQPGLKHARDGEASGDRVTLAGIGAVIAAVILVAISCGVLLTLANNVR